MHTEIRPSGGPQRAGLAERYGTNNPLVIRAIEAMENHIAGPLELGQLTLLGDISARQLNRLFREKPGRSMMKFSSDLRLEKARALVTQSPLSLTEFALAAGVASSAHSSHSFRRRFGVAPSSLRR